MRRFWLASLVLLGTACGLLPGSAPSATSTPEARPASAVPSPSPSPARPTAAASPTAPQAATRPTSAPAQSASAETVYVGNTDGEGVYIRNTPSMADRAQAYPDGTELTIIGDDVDGDGQHWHHVKTPDGLEGYVPSTYTTDAPQ